MDQPSTVKATTQTTPEDRSRHLVSATSSSTDTIMTHGFRYFDFLGLPRELRDMIYDQFQRLHPDTPKFREAGKPELMDSKAVKAKPIIPLLLVNKQIGSEHKDACGTRSRVIVSTSMDFLVPGSKCEGKINSLDNEQISFMHLHAGSWMDRGWGDVPEWTLSPLGNWLAHWDSQLPKLDSITVSLYLHLYSIEAAEERKKLEKALGDFVSTPKLGELKVITMDDAGDWERSNSKELLVHWTSNGPRKPTLIGSPQPYVETCCDLLGPFRSIIADCDSDSDDSSSHSNDGDDSNDSDDDSDDFESSDENDDSGNGFDRDMDDSGEEDAENEDQDANEDPDESDTGDADTIRPSESNQAPSYFDFFGLPQEIRDMTYDQPQTFDQETPFCLHDDALNLQYSSKQMTATKPRTSLLLLNSQFSREYEKRCEGRSGLLISEKLEHFTMSAARMAIPQKAAKDATFMHIHTGEWCNPVRPCRADGPDALRTMALPLHLPNAKARERLYQPIHCQK